MGGSRPSGAGNRGFHASLRRGLAGRAPLLTFLIYTSTCSVQVWLYVPGASLPLRFRTPVFYQVVPHCVRVGWLMVFWSTLRIWVADPLRLRADGHNILAAHPVEERDLAELTGKCARIGGGCRCWSPLVAATAC